MSTLKIDEKSHYINYRLGNENFAISVMRVLEIINNRTLTNVPNSSAYIKGVINFRGEIVPVIDMHKRFNVEKKDNLDGMIVIVNIDSNNSVLHMGLLVDEVEDIVEFGYRDIGKSPDMGIRYNINFIDGIVDINSRFVMVLNIDNVLNKYELADGKIADFK